MNLVDSFPLTIRKVSVMEEREPNRTEKPTLKNLWETGRFNEMDFRTK